MNTPNESTHHRLCETKPVIVSSPWDAPARSSGCASGVTYYRSESQPNPPDNMFLAIGLSCPGWIVPRVTYGMRNFDIIASPVPLHRLPRRCFVFYLALREFLHTRYRCSSSRVHVAFSVLAFWTDCRIIFSLANSVHRTIVCASIHVRLLRMLRMLYENANTPGIPSL